MALDWVQVDVGFSRTLAVVTAAGRLGIERLTFLGHMQELQVWAVQAMPTGRFSMGASADASADEPYWVETLELGACWTGPRGAFWDALLRAGILVREGDSVRLTTSDRYVQALEKRAREAARKREARARRRGDASAGRPPDVRPKKRREEMREEVSTAAAGGSPGASGGRPVLAPPPPPEDVSADALPVQRALPGAHLVPAAPPREERLQAAVMAPGATEAGAEAQPALAGQERPTAFFRRCQEARRVRLGALVEKVPGRWSAWYDEALRELEGDEQRLADAWGGFLESDWARRLHPPCPADAFMKRWRNWVPALADVEPPRAAVDVSTEAGRLWKRCLDRLEQEKKPVALQWLSRASPVSVEDGWLLLDCGDQYFYGWVTEHYTELAEGIARGVGLEGVRWVVLLDQAEPATA
jgi:hypothetical protein